MYQRGRVWQSRASLSTQYVHLVQDVELPFIVGRDEVRWIFRRIRHLQLPVQGLRRKKKFRNCCLNTPYTFLFRAVKGSKNLSWIVRRTLAMTPWRLLAWRKNERRESDVCLNHTVVWYQIASAVVFSHSMPFRFGMSTFLAFPIGPHPLPRDWFRLTSLAGPTAPGKSLPRIGTSVIDKCDYRMGRINSLKGFCDMLFSYFLFVKETPSWW